MSSTLYSLIQTAPEKYKGAVCYALYELGEPHAWFDRPDTADPAVLPISTGADKRYTLTNNPDRYHWLLQGDRGGDIFWGKTRKDVIDFITKSMQRTIAAEERA